jgi:hypothetical protein
MVKLGGPTSNIIFVFCLAAGALYDNCHLGLLTLDPRLAMADHETLGPAACRHVICK